MFWDFLKNFAVAGGFLTLAFGANAGRLAGFLAHPFASTHPYARARAEDDDGENGRRCPIGICRPTQGISRQKRCMMTEFELKSMQPPADPQWQGRSTTTA